MNIQLKRNQIRINTGSEHFDNTCDGNLYIDGLYVCDTTENAKYRIPVGTYDIRLLPNQKWKRKMPTLISSSLPTGEGRGEASVIGIGNGVQASFDGRILVGKYSVPGLVLKSRETFLNLYDRINNSLRRGNQVTLTIK